ncbi:hypothetical protein FOZ61_009765 [Perkinsus olseni]|uniref:Uncharacterized protein n=1 Tax=Perkinsus olseni TaxID=32597 RepID=A0A7J6KYU6_PEROL|nr:hypothetical protein FOZ61_009765 [Perkinsus olseni]
MMMNSFLPLVLVLNSSVMALKTTLSRASAATAQRRIDAFEPDPWSHLCTTNYFTAGKPYEVSIGSSTDPRYGGKDNFFYIATEVPNKDGNISLSYRDDSRISTPFFMLSDLSLSFFSCFGDGTCNLRIGPGGVKDDGLDETAGKEELHALLGDINPFDHLLGDMKVKFNATDCEGMADYIENTPAEGYESGKEWLPKFVLERSSKWRTAMLVEQK